MNLESMTTKFRESTSGLSDSLSDADVATLVNRYYQVVLPSQVGGPFSEILWDLNTSVGVGSYAVPERVVSLDEAKAWIRQGSSGSLRLSVYRDFSRFEFHSPDYDTRSGKPQSVCFFGGSIYFDFLPDAVYPIRIQCRGGPADPIISTSDVERALAIVIVAGCAIEFLTDVEDLEGVQRESARYEKYLTVLLGKYKNYYEPRSPRRSF